MRSVSVPPVTAPAHRRQAAKDRPDTARRTAYARRVVRAVRAAGRLVGATTVVAALLAVPVTAVAAEPGEPVAVNDLPTVIANLQAWLLGILAALATLYLVRAGILWSTAGGDPSQVEKAKESFKNALVGYALAVLAPVALQILQGILGG